MPEARAPIYQEVTTTVIAKLPILTRKEVKAIRPRLYNWANILIEFLDNEELLAVVEDSYLLSGIDKQLIRNKDIFVKEVRRLYKTDDGVKVWIDWVIRIKKFVEDC